MSESSCFPAGSSGTWYERYLQEKRSGGFTVHTYDKYDMYIYWLAIGY
jgi:hypothetical protein